MESFEESPVDEDSAVTMQSILMLCRNMSLISSEDVKLSAGGCFNYGETLGRTSGCNRRTERRRLLRHRHVVSTEQSTNTRKLLCVVASICEPHLEDGGSIFLRSVGSRTTRYQTRSAV